MFGGMLSISKSRNWFWLAIASSIMFALVHGYYAVTYGVVSIVQFIELAVFGIAMCITYYWTDGNLLIPALIHGVHDATGFLAVATTTFIGSVARYAFVGVGLVFAVIYLPKKIRITSEPSPEKVPPPPADLPPPPPPEESLEQQS